MTRFAAIIDFENLAHDNRRATSCDAVGGPMTFVRALTCSVQSTLAIKAGLAPRYMSVVGGPWRLRLVDNRPNGADAALLEAADDYVAAGVTDLIVVSGDRCFAALRPSARLHVVSFGDRLSRVLEAAATSTLLLDPTITRAGAA